MSSSIHIIKLRLIESRIQRALYRIDRSSTTRESLRLEVDKLLRQLDRWIEHCPERPSSTRTITTPCCSKDWFSHKYDECRQLLLRPMTSSVDGGDIYLSKLAASAANLCQVSIISPERRSKCLIRRSNYACTKNLLRHTLLRPYTRSSSAGLQSYTLLRQTPSSYP
jgi:hypothetical protein